MPINDVNATVFQGCQFEFESSYGVAVPAARQLLALGLEPGINSDSKKFRPMGRKYTTVVAQNKEYTQVTLQGEPTYTELPFPLACILEHSVSGSGIYTHVFNTHPGARDDIKSMTVEYGSDLGARRFAGAVVSSFGMAFSRNNGLSLSGDMIGQPLEEGITLTASPTAVPLIPVLSSDVDFYIDTAAANLGDTQIELPFSIDWKIGPKFNPVFALNSGNGTGFRKVAEKAPDHMLTLVTAYDSDGQALLSQFRAGTKLFLRVHALGPIFTGSTHYEFTLDFCGEITQPQKFEDQDGAYAIGYQLDAVEDDDWAKVVEITIVNDQPIS